MKKAILASCVGVSLGGQVELITSDLTGGGGAGKVLDNIKGSWSQSLKFLGADANLEGKYDRNDNEKFLSEATLSGKVDDVNYELTTDFRGSTELTASVATKDGTAVEVVASKDDGITKLTASRATQIQGRDVDVEASHAPKSGESKVKLSTLLGHGVRAIATFAPKKDADYELEYESSVGEGRALSANVNPKTGSGEIEFVDSKSIDATVTASMPLGGKPKLTVKRSWGF